MNCQICEELLQQRLDGAFTSDIPEMERHLAECPRCAKRFAAGSRLLAGLRLIAAPRPPLDLEDRLVAAVVKDQRAAQKRRRIRIAAFAVAASLLVAAGVIALTFRSQGPEPVIVDNTPTRPSDDKKPPTAPTVSVRGSVTDAGNALASLTTRTADETVGHSRLLVPTVTGPVLDELDMPPGLEPTMSYLEAGQGVTVALQPLTNFRAARVDLFRRDLPHVERTTKP